jgi:hypothetical protein
MLALEENLATAVALLSGLIFHSIIAKSNITLVSEDTFQPIHYSFSIKQQQ